MELILWAIFIAILLLIFSPTLRAWLLARILMSLQRRIFRDMERRQGFSAGGQERGRSGGSEEASRGGTSHRSPTDKLDMDDIATKKFDKPQSEDYVDFEELPK